MTLVMNPKVEIKDSPIEGKGIFATQKFVKGEEIWIAKGGKPSEAKIYNDEEFQLFIEQCLKDGKQWDAVSLGNGKHRAAIADRASQPENYGNHSCDPNIQIMDNKTIAARDIEPGEEITVDYAQFSDKAWEMECNCGSKKCKGTVKGKK